MYTGTTVLHKLKSLYSPPKTFLHYRTPIDLLIVTLLSAQCTDKKVNEVGEALFRKYHVAQDYADVSRAVLERDIHSTGFYRQKAKNIQALCRILLMKHGGNVPQTMEELVALPGVGRKTASIVLSVAFGINEGIACDTHVMRVAKRLGLVQGRTPEAIERELMVQTPREEWGNLTTLMISHGRAICTAMKPQCSKCVFKDKCPSSLRRLTLKVRKA